MFHLPSHAYPAHTGPHGDQYAYPTTLGKAAGPESGYRAAGVVPPLGWVRLEADDDADLALLCRLGEGNLDVTSGVGGWDEVARPGRMPITRWRHAGGLRVEVPLWMNDVLRHSIEPQIAVLAGLAGLGPKGRAGEPPHLLFDTAGVSPYDAQSYPDRSWVIDSLTWGTNALHNHAGNRYRQDATVTLLAFYDDQVVPDQSLARRRQHRGKYRIKHKNYTVRKGDTLVSIARREMGSVDRWIEIVVLNRHVSLSGDPRRELKPGTVLHLRR